MSSIDILYEDNHLIIVNKRPGQIVQGDKTGDKPLSEHLKDFIRERDHKPGNVYVGVVHRIDRPVSGAVIFAKTSKALSRMNELVRTRGISKIYWAVVSGKPEKEARLKHFLRKNQEKNISRAYDKRVAGSLEAELTYRLLSTSDNYHLLEVDLHTGRHHQVRCQLAAVGLPVKGDVKYGARRGNIDASIHLHARSLRFVHPVSGKEVHILATPPPDPLWDHFLGSIDRK